MPGRPAASTAAAAKAVARRRPAPPELAEAVFDSAYLAFDCVAAVCFFALAKGRPVFVLYGFLALILGGGDAFHLVPRVQRALFGADAGTERRLGLGLLVSSVTMTVFYLVLAAIWRLRFPAVVVPRALPWLLWGSALARIAVCLLPQNDWFHEGGNARLSWLRNGLFVVTGGAVIALFARSGAAGGLGGMVPAIALSFGCYLPVTLLSHRYPKVGALMIPKTCAYIWMLVMGLKLL